MRTPFLLIFFSLLFVSATPQVTSVTADQVDVNGDGLVNTVDVVEVYKYIKENKNIEGEVTVTPWNEENIDGGEAEE